MTRYCLQHRSTRVYLTRWPSLGLGLHTSPEITEAASHRIRTPVELERIGLEDFGSAWEIVLTEVPSIYDRLPGDDAENADLDLPLT